MIERPEKYPYVLIREFYGRQYTKIRYVHKDAFEAWMLDDRDVPEKALGMAGELASFIREWCTCPYCHNAVPFDLGRCNCGMQQHPYIEVQFLGEKLNSIFSQLSYSDWNKRKSLAKSIRRRGRVSATQTAYSKEEISSLLHVQECSCYYCGNSLVAGVGKNQYHIDHYVSLSNGGRNDIQNLVLACPKCNLKKSWWDGRYFSYSVTRSLGLGMKNKVKKIKAKVRLYKKKIARVTESK